MGRGLDRTVTQHFADDLERGTLAQQTSGCRVAQDVRAIRRRFDTSTLDGLRGNSRDDMRGDRVPRCNGGDKNIVAVD
jgi:hypothetical protein